MLHETIIAAEAVHEENEALKEDLMEVKGEASHLAELMDERDHKEPIAAQEHLETALQNNYRFSEEQVRQWREQSHLVPADPEYPDIYTNFDVTATVDPVGHKHWIIDDANRHHASDHRGRAKNHSAVLDTIRHLNSGPAPPRTFIPTSNMLDSSLKFSARCVANSTRGDVKIGRSEDAGELPVISQLVWEDKLPRAPDWAVDRMLQLERNLPNRAFDCEGWCR